MTILVCGGRHFANWQFLFRELDKLHKANAITALISGGAFGADSLAQQWADKNKIPFLLFRADWTKYGKGAGRIRNKQMLVEGKPDLVVAFPGGIGTRDMINQAKHKAVDVIEFT